MRLPHADGIAGKQTPSVQLSSITFSHDAKTFPAVLIVRLMDAFIYLPIYLFGKTESLTFGTFYPGLKLEVNDPKPSRTAAEWTLLWGDAKVWRGACLHKAFAPVILPRGKVRQEYALFSSGQLLGKRVVASQLHTCGKLLAYSLPSCVSSLLVHPPPNLSSSHSSDL